MLISDQSIKTGLIIGCGSIGRKYLSVMQERYARVLVVDIDRKYVNELNQLDSTQIRAFTEIEASMDQEVSNPLDLVAVISNWGPDHFLTYIKLVNYGVKRIIIEKPLVTSKKLAYDMYEHAKLNNVLLIPAMPRRYSGYYNRIRTELVAENLGNPEVMTMVGGAQCIATNGIHWLDLACQLFESFPRSVYAKIHESQINPRSQNLGFYEGNASWFFPELKQFSINLTNSSYFRAEINLICEYGALRIDNSGNVTIHKISNTNQNMTNTPVTKVLGTLTIKHLDMDLDDDPILLQIQAAEGTIEPRYSIEDSIEVINALISAFESSENNVPIEITSISEMQNHKKEWNFS